MLDLSNKLRSYMGVVLPTELHSLEDFVYSLIATTKGAVDISKHFDASLLLVI